MAGRVRLSSEEVMSEIAGLDTCDTAVLLARWRKLTGRLPGSGLRGELLRSALAYKLQEQSSAGLTPADLKRLERYSKEHVLSEKGDLPDKRILPSRVIKSGSRLIREWKGVIHEVTVLEDGYLWQENKHSSLSTIAKSITGTQWNGWRFFCVDRSREKLAREKLARKKLTREKLRQDLDAFRRRELTP